MTKMYLTLITVALGIFVQNVSSQKEVFTEILNTLSLNGECGYYGVLEAYKMCGPSGYPFSKGYKYCKKFQDFSDRYKEEVSGREGLLGENLVESIAF
jgi:hypothetical protein